MDGYTVAFLYAPCAQAGNQLSDDNLSLIVGNRPRGVARIDVDLPLLEHIQLIATGKR